MPFSLLRLPLLRRSPKLLRLLVLISRRRELMPLLTTRAEERTVLRSQEGTYSATDAFIPLRRIGT